MIETFALCLYLAALPLEQFSAMGTTIIKLAGGLALAGWLLGRLRSHDPIRWDPGLTLMALFGVWGTASTFWSMNPTRTIEKLPTYALLFVSYFLIVNVIRNEKQLSAAMVAMWLGALMLVVSGTVELAAASLRMPGFRLGGISGNPNGYVSTLLVLFPSCYWVVTRSRVLLIRVVAVAVLVLAGITSLYTLSRGGILSIAVLISAVLLSRRTRWRDRALVLVVAVLLLRLAPLQLWQRFDETRRRGGDVRTLDLWPAGLKALARNPLTGSGLGTNVLAISPLAEHEGKAVHNAPLAIAIELGIPGLALYCSFVVFMTVRLLQALATGGKRGQSSKTQFAVVLLASLAGYLVGWFKGGGMEYSKFLWVLLGLMSAYARILEQRPIVDDV